ncbi:MAG: hypothetical protein LBS64_05955 [Spirochaetaceae bacterium]|jgi:hypothetical protein|nr:hypothetical protein [Spirochaetaceae bacterium]
MINPKYVVFAAAGGFLLSFLVGLVSGGGISPALLRALVFGLLFGIIAVGINVLAAKLLTVPAEESRDDEKIAPQVDITVDDDVDFQQEKDPATFELQGLDKAVADARNAIDSGKPDGPGAVVKKTGEPEPDFDVRELWSSFTGPVVKDSAGNSGNPGRQEQGAPRGDKKAADSPVKTFISATPAGFDSMSAAKSIQSLIAADHA